MAANANNNKAEKKAANNEKQPKWTNEQESQLIDFYKDHEFLWNSKHSNYFRAQLRQTTLSTLATSLGESFTEPDNNYFPRPSSSSEDAWYPTQVSMLSKKQQNPKAKASGPIQQVHGSPLAALQSSAAVATPRSGGSFELAANCDRQHLSADHPIDRIIPQRDHVLTPAAVGINGNEFSPQGRPGQKRLRPAAKSGACEAVAKSTVQQPRFSISCIEHESSENSEDDLPDADFSLIDRVRRRLSRMQTEAGRSATVGSSNQEAPASAASSELLENRIDTSSANDLEEESMLEIAMDAAPNEIIRPPEASPVPPTQTVLRTPPSVRRLEKRKTILLEETVNQTASTGSTTLRPGTLAAEMKAHLEKAKMMALKLLLAAKSEADTANLLAFLNSLSHAVLRDLWNSPTASSDAMASARLIKLALRISLADEVVAITATPLMLAVLQGNGLLVNQLLIEFAEQIDIEVKGSVIVAGGVSKSFDLLTCAVARNSPEVLQTALTRRCNPVVAICAAVELMRTDFVDMLLDSLPPANERKVFEANGSEFSLQDLCEAVAGLAGVVPILEKLSARRVEVSVPAIVAALRGGHQDVVDWVLSNATSRELQATFLRCVQKANEESCSHIQKMLRHNPQCFHFADTSGRTTLMVAAQGSGRVEVLKAILDAAQEVGDADFVNARTADGTALHFAVEENCLPAAELLLRRGANPLLANDEGSTPLMCAVVRCDGSPEAKNFLISYVRLVENAFSAQMNFSVDPVGME